MIVIDFESGMATSGSSRCSNRNNVVVPEGCVAQNSSLGIRIKAIVSEWFIAQNSILAYR